MAKFKTDHNNLEEKVETVKNGLKQNITPLYRYFNGKDHFYTTSPDEIGTT